MSSAQHEASVHEPAATAHRSDDLAPASIPATKEALPVGDDLDEKEKKTSIIDEEINDLPWGGMESLEPSGPSEAPRSHPRSFHAVKLTLRILTALQETMMIQVRRSARVWIAEAGLTSQNTRPIRVCADPSHRPRAGRLRG